MDKLPKGWKWSTINEVCNKITDGTHKTPSYIDKGVPFLSVKDITKGYIDFSNTRFISLIEHNELSKRCNPERNDILYTKVGTTGVAKVIDTDREFSLFVSLALLKPKKEIIESYFFEHLLNSPFCYEQSQAKTRGVANRNLVITDIKSIQIPLPPLPEQTRIVSKLDTLFVRIDKSIALLEENIRHAKALIASVLDEVFGGGAISLFELCLINPKKSEIRGTEENTQVSFLPMADLNEYQMDFQVKQIKKLSEVYSGYTYFRDNDVLVAKVTPCFENGKAGIARNLQNSIGFGSSEYHVIRTKGNVLSEWIYYSVMTSRIREEGVNNMTGSSGLKRVPAKFIETWKIKQPSIEVQKETIDKIQVLDKKLKAIISAQQSKLTYLKALKSSLLDRAFKGEL